MTKEKLNPLSFRLVSVDERELLVGLLLIVSSFFMPLIFNVHTFEVDRSIMPRRCSWWR